MRNTRAAALFLIATVGVASDAPTQEELEAWFEDDAAARAASVSTGELAFLATPPEGRVPHSQNVFTITPASLEDGWVGLVQCYDHLDAVPEAEVVYQYKQMRGLAVQSALAIERAWVEGQSVQLVNVQRGAKLCIGAEVRTLYANADGSFSLVNGPFHRKFLDGYYPMRVTLEVQFPPDVLCFADTQPVSRPGLRVAAGASQVTFDAWFVGELNTEIRFTSRCRQPTFSR